MFIQQLVSGIAMGSIYALVAMGFTLIFKSLKVVNFAQGDLFMMGAMFGYTFYSIIGLPLVFSIAAGIVSSFILGMIFERIALNPLKNAPEMSILLVTLATGIFLQNLARLIWGADTLPFDTFFKTQTLHLGSISIRTQDLVIVAFTIIAVLSFHYFFQYTRYGKALRATSMDRPTASAMGVNVRMMILIAIAIASVLGGLAGMLIAPVYFIYPTMGVMIGLKAFIAAVIGGLNHIYGALIGGLFLGVMETLVAGYISSSYKDIVAFVILIIVLRFLPSGILGQKAITKV